LPLLNHLPYYFARCFFNWFFIVKLFFQYFYFFFLAVFLAAFFAFLATDITSFSEK